MIFDLDVKKIPLKLEAFHQMNGKAAIWLMNVKIFAYYRKTPKARSTTSVIFFFAVFDLQCAKNIPFYNPNNQ
jgi:hypothetical protein